MIVATNVFDMPLIREMVKKRTDLCAYVHGLVPDRYKHVNAIEHNTRYLLNLNIVNDDSISLDNKLWATQELTKNLHVVGYIDSIVTTSDVEKIINMKKVEKYYEGDKYGKSS